MDRGLPYDSDAGRAYAAAVTALMHGEAYAQSARVASAMGPFAGYAKNAEPMLRVIDKHRKHAHMVDSSLVPKPLMQAALDVWDEAYALGAQHGYRNSQVTVLAPTGTIGFMMDCDTTGHRARHRPRQVQEARGRRGDEDRQPVRPRRPAQAGLHADRRSRTSSATSTRRR